MMNDYNDNNIFGMSEQPINNSQKIFDSQEQLEKNEPNGFDLQHSMNNDVDNFESPTTSNSMQQQPVQQVVMSQPQIMVMPQSVSQLLEQPVSNGQTDYNEQQNMNQQPVYNQPNLQVQQPINNGEGNFKNKKKNIVIMLIIISVVVLGLIIAKSILGKKVNTNDYSLKISDLIKVKKGDKYGFIDIKGKFRIQPIYKNATDFYGDYAKVRLIEITDGVEKDVYQVIDKDGNIKFTSNYSSHINYYEDYNVWILDNQLYNSFLNKISSDGVEIENENDGYFKWYNKNDNTAGIIDISGKITFTYKFNDGERYFAFTPSKIDNDFKEKYCAIIIDNKKYAIVNCDTGKVAYDFTDKYISVDRNNIFSIHNQENSFELISEMYIQNDRVAYQTSSNYFSADCVGDCSYVRIYDGDKEYSERYSYIDVHTGQVSTDTPKSSNNSVTPLDEWEEYTNYTKFSCKDGYGIIKGDNIIIPCNWTSISYLDLSLYKYLQSNGKEYVLSKKDNKAYLLNLKDGKTIIEFNTTYIRTKPDSTFIYYEDAETKKSIIYNLMTNKSMTSENMTNTYLYSNYLTIKENGKVNYYNMDLELIYTEE